MSRSTFSTAFCKVERRPSNQTVSSTASHRPSNIPFAWFILFERNRQAWADVQTNQANRGMLVRRSGGWEARAFLPLFSWFRPSHLSGAVGRYATVQPNLWEGCILNSFLKGGRSQRGVRGARASPFPPPSPPGKSIQAELTYPSRLEGLVWIRLGFSSDFPQELGLYA